MKKLFAIVAGVIFLFCGACCEKKVTTKGDGAVKEEPQEPKDKPVDEAKKPEEAKPTVKAGDVKVETSKKPEEKKHEVKKPEPKLDDKPAVKKTEPKPEKKEEAPAAKPSK